MAFYLGRKMSSTAVIKKGKLLNVYQSLQNNTDAITSTFSHRADYSFVPIFYDVHNINIDYILEHIIPLTITFINDAYLNNVNNSNVTMLIDVNHLHNQPEDNSIKNGRKRGIKKVLYTEIIGK